MDKLGIWAVLAVAAGTLFILMIFESADAQAIDWIRQFGTSAQSLTTDPSGNIYVVGEIGGSSGGTEAFVRKYDSLGNELWTRQFGALPPPVFLPNFFSLNNCSIFG